LTLFIVLASLMASAALALLVWPLYRARAAEGRAALATALVVALVLPLAAFGLYRALSNWNWDPAAMKMAAGGAHSIEEMVAGLESRLKRQPDDVNGWMMLGRSQVVLNRYPRAVEAYEQAYKLTGGRNIDALLGYAEALALSDPQALQGRAGQLFEDALALEPQNPRALWYGGIAALRSGRNALARDRWAALVKLDPPPEVKAVLVERVADLDRQLGRPPEKLAATPTTGPAATAAGAARTAPAAATQAAGGQGGGAAAPTGRPGVVTVQVSIAPTLAARVPAGAPLYVLARDPTQPGPPFGAKRLTGATLPTTVVLTEQDAMLPTRTIATARQLLIVARYSASGLPTAASGDLYGEVPYDLGAGKPTALVIDKTVP